MNSSYPCHKVSNHHELGFSGKFVLNCVPGGVDRALEVPGMPLAEVG